MRFGLLGPANGDLATLEQGAKFLLFEREADLVIYLGADDGLDRLVLDWARRLVGDDPTEARIWERAAERCPGGSPSEIDGFLAAERTRERLKALKCLPGDALTIEMLEGRVAVLLYDKGLLDEEDILPASLLIFGKSHEPVVRNVGARTFIAPGELTGPAGVALLTDQPTGEVELEIFCPDGLLLESHLLASARTGTVRVIAKTTSERS